MGKVLVIIVTYNGMRWAERCLGSLGRSEMPVDAFVVDNGSTDGTPEWIKEHYPEAHLVQSEENLGFGAANNIGMRYALDNGYDYVYLLNQDAWILPDTVGKLVGANQADESFVLLSPVQMNDGLEEMNKRFGTRIVKSRTEIGEDLWSVPFVMAAHWLISRKCLEEVGLFSPLFFMYGEDDNYCSRVLYRGYRIGIVPSAKAVHDIGNREEAKERYIYKCIYTYALNRYSDPGKCPFFQLIYMALYSVYSSFKFRSLLPVKLFGKSLRSFRKAKDFRKQSMPPGAFI